ncbi:TonB-dependent receptor [Paludibaculum fermentans]|uniref:Carboxypeptidase regulatory-like domain-containing protein n=1 Tax=Paludibaculum fermentans TaxID=1473598 RepID=A0A7S7NXN2_PALFE|nr:TonB-dependent receptor [Paludibaculum fermentans]QOY91685.1 carboxypeptidase regulatory-like domain-containing protein [Paludibaculum fermentans]
MLHVRVTRLLIVGLLFAFCLMAQRDLGTIAGTVTDPQGGVIPNAKVTIKEEATGLTYDLTTNSSGEFARPALKPGNYTVTAEATGFRRVAQQNVVLVGGDRVAVPMSLPVGNVSESVEVSAQAPLLQTETTTLGADLGRRAVSELPLGGQRTFSFLARLSPGVVPAEGGARDAVGGGFSANGVRSNGQNNFLLNGVDNNVNVIDFLNQTAFVVGPSVEAIGEMRVLTNGYNAEYGRGAGGVVNVNLKSGTNEVHGVLFEILQNDKINANRWEYNKAGKPRGPFKQNQYGAAIGAPIIKNKLFIFGDYQGTRITSSGGSIQNLGYGGFYTIPTAAMRQGDFSKLLGSSVGTDANGNNIVANQIFDPKSNATVNGQLIRTPFTGNMIPSSRFDPAAAKLMGLFPNENQPVKAGVTPFNDYFASTAGRQNTDQGDGRVDYRLSDKDSLFGSLSWQNTNKFNEPFLPGALDGTPFNAVTEEDLSRNAQLSYTRVWNPSIVSETRVGFSRLVTSRVGANPDKDLFKEFGIGGYNPMTALNGGLPQMQFSTGYTQIGANDWLPSKEYSNVWDFIQNVSIMKGHHSYKFGAEYRPIKFPFFQVPYPHGEMNFNRNETAYPSATGTQGALNTLTGDDYASFLLGNINNGRVSTNNFISSEKVAWAFYFQDDWKLTPKLTLNIGMRYELFSPIGEKFARQSNFVYDNLTLFIPKGKDQDAPLPPNFPTAFPNVKVSRGEVDKYMIPWDKTNFAPRIGLAYNWRDNTVIRLGYGAFYGGEENQGGNPNRGESVPFNQSTDLARPTSAIFDVNPFFTNGLAGGFPSNVFSLNAPVSFRGVAVNFRNSLVHKWNFAVQRQLPWQSSLEIAYVGNHQAHQLFQPDWNACANIGTTSSTMQGCSTALRPTPYIGGISGTASFGFGDYHGMTTKFDKRYSNGLMLMASYTYGHALANTGTTLSGSTGFGTLDPRNYSSSYSTAAWDIRHNFVSNFTYEIPFGKGKTYGTHMNTVVNALVGNWQANGILTLRTGQPFTLRSNGCQGIWNSCMPDLVAGQDPQAAPTGGRNPDKWFNTAAVTAPASLTGGNLGLQSNTGPAGRTLDFSLFKDFAFTERIKLQFRAEGTNVANTPQFGIPDNNRQNSTFGVINSTNSGTERHMQFALRLQF